MEAGPDFGDALIVTEHPEAFTMFGPGSPAFVFVHCARCDPLVLVEVAFEPARREDLQHPAPGWTLGPHCTGRGARCVASGRRTLSGPPRSRRPRRRLAHP